MVVSYGHSLTIRLMTSAFHGERVNAEYLVYRMTLTVIYFRYLVSACHYLTKIVAVHQVLLKHAFNISQSYFVRLQTMVSGMAAITRFLGKMLSFVNIDTKLIIILVLIVSLMLSVLHIVILMFFNASLVDHGYPAPLYHGCTQAVVMVTTVLRGNGHFWTAGNEKPQKQS